MSESGSFRRPFVLNEQFIEFLRKADLGVDEVNKSIKDKLYFIKKDDPLYGVTNRITLLKIFQIYVKVNKLSSLSTYNQDVARQLEPEYKDPMIIGSDDLMIEHFQDIFDKITIKSQRKLQSLGIVDKQPKPQRTKCRHKRYYFYDIIDLPDGSKQIGTTHPIWKDFYHEFDPFNFFATDFLNIITLSVDGHREIKITRDLLDKIADLDSIISKNVRYARRASNKF